MPKKKQWVLLLLSLGLLVGCSQNDDGPCNCEKDTCLNFGDSGSYPAVYQGTLIVGNDEGPNGQPYRPWILKMKDRICVAGNPAIPDAPEAANAGPTRELQLAGSGIPNVQVMRSVVGKRILVNGTLFHSHTAWHVTPVLIDVNNIAVPSQ